MKLHILGEQPDNFSIFVAFWLRQSAAQGFFMRPCQNACVAGLFLALLQRRNAKISRDAEKSIFS